MSVEGPVIDWADSLLCLRPSVANGKVGVIDEKKGRRLGENGQFALD